MSDRFDIFFANIRAHVLDAERFNNLPRAEVWIAVLVEEVGKLARASNKLSLLPDTPTYEAERAKWRRDARHRLVTIATTAARVDELWPQLTHSEGAIRTLPQGAQP